MRRKCYIFKHLTFKLYSNWKDYYMPIGICYLTPQGIVR